jgi:poly(3-hydroxyalkanoate) synthetase
VNLRPDAPGPLRRLGPRPLWLHLTLATQPYSAWQSALRNWSAGSPNWRPETIQDLAAPAPDAALLAGIAAYRRHPWHRTQPDPPAIWTEGSSALLDYGPPDGLPMLVVPSLVNRAYVLDLLPDHSMMRFLAAGGIRPLLLDWGFPDEAERGFSLSDYIAGRLDRALQAVCALTGGAPVALAGYCMGGLMAVAAALARPELVSRLALLATPWDFWADDPVRARALGALLPALEPAFSLGGALPVDALQTLFSLMDPGSVAAKYRDFGRQDQASPRARMFVALEDWLNDGVPLPAQVARETLGGWYGANSPALGNWRVLGLKVDPGQLRLPCLVAAPGRDRIVPPESARALAAAIPGAELHLPQAGHIGMVAGSSARAVLWDKLAAWILQDRLGGAGSSGQQASASF